ncbi:primase homolog protein-like isoform X2 [Salvia miltiorrhiza]|uniref:primase homolog protein-like isoform X2 n=1 Tax=Salvia miltiorrhiza TaxID=226208 RepID=UPI0025ACDA2F|nr:primase homolog protein-like isoform X2 [Salvia miltiorrhiza]
MLFLPARKLFLSSSSKTFLLLKSSTAPATYACLHSLHDCSSTSPRTLRFYSSSRFFLHLSYQRASRCSHTPYSATPVPRQFSGVNDESLGKQFIDDKKLMILRKKLQEIGIDGSSCTPGRYNGLVCPSCKGGDSHEKSLSLSVTEDGGAAVWTCFRAKCGWKGATTRAFAGVKSTYLTKSKIKIKESRRTITEESIGLEPLSSKLLAYFADRVISGETLRRNAVMQKRKGDQVAIAFTYHRNGKLVSCKYRDTAKRFWQVEGEMDKLAMEEAGFKNCVSVPDGAPPKVSAKELPTEEKDTGFQYLWNCKDYFVKVSRIILATDGDKPGQSLAEELARRLGKERCWRVHWPRKDHISSFNDANEVLMFLGADAVRVAIEKAELYQIQNLENRCS